MFRSTYVFIEDEFCSIQPITMASEYVVAQLMKHSSPCTYFTAKLENETLKVPRNYNTGQFWLGSTIVRQQSTIMMSNRFSKPKYFHENILYKQCLSKICLNSEMNYSDLWMNRLTLVVASSWHMVRQLGNLKWLDLCIQAHCYSCYSWKE